MNILFFDTETNGTPKNWKAPMQELDNWPRVIQLAWQIANINGQVVTEVAALVKPDAWTIPKENFWTQHGYSTEHNQLHGHPLPGILDSFITDIRLHDVQVIVAHNIAFDYNVLGSEMLRYGKTTGRKLTQICTMLRGVDICKLPGKYGYKWPKLEELYRHLFNMEMEGAHDAGNDVSACRKIFFELLNKGLIDISSFK